MPLDPSIVAKIAGYQQELRSEREENNRRFPIVAIVKPAIERVFGPCKVIYAENYETGEKIGVQQRFLPWPDFGKYGGSSAPVLRDSSVNGRIRPKAERQIPRNSVAEHR